MHTNKLTVGGIYHDGKLGVREITAIERHQSVVERVTYTILAAKHEVDNSYVSGPLSLIGTTSTCDLTSFARWAKTEVLPKEKEELLANIAASKLRLPPGEAAFMKSVTSAFDAEQPITAGTSVSYNFNETRSARGMEKKGLATVVAGPAGAGGEINLTELGAAWCRLHARKEGA